MYDVSLFFIWLMGRIHLTKGFSCLVWTSSACTKKKLFPLSLIFWMFLQYMLVFFFNICYTVGKKVILDDYSLLKTTFLVSSSLYMYQSFCLLELPIGYFNGDQDISLAILFWFVLSVIENTIGHIRGWLINMK